MLRRQSFPSDPMSFLAGGSEMARRIRDFDWSNHPFGLPSAWPQSLRSALSICLHSSFPMAIYWGSELRLLYNDSWSHIPGPRHPAALGAPAAEVWRDIWEVIEPQFSEVIASGEGLFVQDQLLPMQRYGLPEETYWNYSFTAIRGEDGSIEGIFNSGHETTTEVLSRKQLAFLLDLNTKLRSCASALELRTTAVQMLGEHLQVERAGFRWLDPLARELSIVEEWNSPGIGPVGNAVRLQSIGEWATDQLAAGVPLRINDVSDDKRLGKGTETFKSLGVGALIAVPWVEDRNLTAILFVHSAIPRTWSDFDLGTMEEVLEKTVESVSQQRIAEREKALMREIDHRAKNVLAVAQSIISLSNADDIKEFRQKVATRIAALARTHDLLSDTRWQSIDLRKIVSEELAPYKDKAEYFEISGTSIPLKAGQAQMLALFFHELFTNSAKYGALSNSNGRITIRWERETDNDVKIFWREYTRLAVSPTLSEVKKGFGSLLFDRVIGQQLDGELSREFLSDGLECTLRIPL